ncbi:MAG: Hsp20 family protein [Alphaproteobacteria bacterium]|nr:Hsp20 family protein [Alphaproteobacteria bacterium]
MNTFDLSPLTRTTVGFDHLMRIVDSAMRSESAQEAYPPYNIEKTGEDTYRIVVAVAGFSEDEIQILVQDNTLAISGKASRDKNKVEYLYRGIAGRAFEKHFQLADFIKIGDVYMENGLLKIELIREIPEAMKPRVIKIQSKENRTKLIEQSK